MITFIIALMCMNYISQRVDINCFMVLYSDQELLRSLLSIIMALNLEYSNFTKILLNYLLFTIYSILSYYSFKLHSYCQ
jgi:hypothetical protein